MVHGEHGCPVARRRVLLGVGASGLAALLAACGGDPPAGPGAAAGSQATPATQPPGAPASEEPAGPELPDGALVEIAEVPVGGGLVVDDVLVLQPTRGRFMAYRAICPHQAVTLEPPDPGMDRITCPGHLSHFRVSDGFRIDGPAPRGLTKVDVKATDGYVVTVS